ncbi:MAG: DNA polymerase III subunit beta [Bacteroidales bacterium]|jgi:DNA polymerase-3 subunit beta|nr:DNA polymerase III subunit beta [Bacteroidales bacterium]
MKFVISSTVLLGHLQAISRVISNKNTLPILDNFLFQLHENELKITASDLETTLITSMDIENATDDGVIALPARILTDILKEFADQPLTFNIDLESYNVKINSENGEYNVVGLNGEDFPQLPVIKDDIKKSIQVPTELLLNGIDKTLFATADDELRPVMNGIFIELSEDNITFVASDSHKLVRYRRLDISADEESNFILPKKPASLLKNILSKDDNEVKIEFDDKNAFFTLPNYKLVSRLVEGNYPSYNSVIPDNNPHKLTIDRLELYNSLKRVSLFSNQASNLVKLDVKGNQLTVSAQDIDFSISADERLNCQYEGDDMAIGFKSSFLVEILSNLPSSDILIELSDPSRAGVLFPVDNDNEDEDVLMLLMPMMINS